MLLLQVSSGSPHTFLQVSAQTIMTYYDHLPTSQNPTSSLFCLFPPIIYFKVYLGLLSVILWGQDALLLTEVSWSLEWHLAHGRCSIGFAEWMNGCSHTPQSKAVSPLLSFVPLIWHLLCTVMHFSVSLIIYLAIWGLPRQYPAANAFSLHGQWLDFFPDSLILCVPVPSKCPVKISIWWWTISAVAFSFGVDEHSRKEHSIRIN